MASAASDAAPFDAGDTSFIIICGALVFFMIPGLAFLYSGLSRRKSALTMVLACSFSSSVGIFMWYFWCYSLAFSPTATNGYIGNLHNFGLQNALAEPSPGSPYLPTLLYAFYQSGFACVTISIVMGAIVDRGRLLPGVLPFSILWLTIVYCPLAYWAWGTNGWAAKWGVLDFAGGGPVEIGSGVAGLAYSWVLGRRRPADLINFRPHHVAHVATGTFILWFGWLGFNGGSAFGSNLRAVVAVVNSNICAAMGGIAWCLLDYRVAKKYSVVGFCSGTIAGLVAATPTSGYIPFWASVILGLVVGAVCNYATKIKCLIGVDDALDLFGVHAVGGVIGILFNGLFASRPLAALDNITDIPGGWTYHHYIQLPKQIGYAAACVGYTFVMTAILAAGLNYIPGCQLRAPEDAENRGMDDDQLGEFAQDFMEVRRDYLDWGLTSGDVTPTMVSVRGAPKLPPTRRLQSDASEQVAPKAPDIPSSDEVTRVLSTVVGVRHGVPESKDGFATEQQGRDLEKAVPPAAPA